MQRPRTIPLNLNVGARPASMGFVPPTWPDLFPFLIFSAVIWLCVLAAATTRSMIYRFLRSAAFRDKVREARRNQTRDSLLMRSARLFRDVSFWLQRKRPPESLVARYFGLPRSIVGCLICVLYMIDTYTQGIPRWCYFLQCIYGVAISANLIFQFIYVERPVKFAFTITTIVDCLSIPSLLLSSGGRWLNFNFLQAYCVLMEWNVLERHDIVLQNTAAVWRLSLNLFLQLATFLYVTSCGVQFFELLGELPFQSLKSETFQITWANSVYFAVVTLMTVGYGDFVPYTFLGRMWVVFHIIFAAYLVSRGISLLIEALQSMRRGDGSYVNSPGTEHVVITGHVKWEFLRQFVSEFLGDLSNIGTRVIVLTSNPNWNEGDWNRFVDIKPLFDHHLMYLDGSALKTDDLHRAHVDAARAVFVLADPRGDPYKEDSDILKAVLTIRNYSCNVPVYTLNMLQESSFQFGIALEHSEPTSPDMQLRMHAQADFPMSSTLFGQSFIPGLSAARIGVADSEDDPGRSQFLHDMESAGDFEGISQMAIDLRSGDLPGVQDPESTPFNPIRRRRELSRNRKSSSLCMRELETVFLAENVFCSGLSTLISNATLRVGSPANETDPPWLKEYKLGTECNLRSFEVHDAMDGVEFKDMAMIFQDYGLLLIAVRENFHSDWKIISTNLVLQKGMTAMALTYFEGDQVDLFAYEAARTLEALGPMDPEDGIGESGSVALEDFTRAVPFQGDIGHLEALRPPTLSTVDERYVDQSVVLNSGDGRPSSSTADYVDSSSLPKSFTTEERDPQTVASRPQSSSYERRTHTTGTANVGLPSGRLRPELDPNVLPEDKSMRTRLRLQDNTTRNRGRDYVRRRNRRPLTVYLSIDKLPAALRGHVIICLEGENALTNLDYLLKRIWIRRPGQKRRTPIVVIHPRFPKNFAKRLGMDQDGLFLLQGNSLAIDTLKQAQYQSAKAFLIMASDNREVTERGSTDSKAIFTVMALDSLLAKQNIFVCCVLDAEGSLELLRAPKQERRVGELQMEHREPDLFNYERSSMLGLPARTTSSVSMVRNYPSSHQLSALHYGTFSQNPNQSGIQRRRSRADGLRSRNMTGLSVKIESDSSDGEASEFFPDTKKMKDRDTTERRSREELFERQRYASGEMMISSLFTALLAREYTDPGYIRLIRQLIGASSGSTSGSWIRQLAIPDSWASVDETGIESIVGRTYRDLSEKLITMGCIALGLYRSGDAPVRITLHKEEATERGDTESLDDMDYYFGSYRGDSFSSGLMHGGGSILRTLDNQSFEAAINDGETRVFDEDGPDEFDKRMYTCPTTKRRFFYEEVNNRENALPYVYCFPEPYTYVTSTDMVFVLCSPMTEVSKDWEN